MASASIAHVLVGCAVVPIGLLVLFGNRMVMPPMWVHFFGVGVSALAATVAAVALTTAGARQGDTRTVIVGGAFSLMAALLAVHGLVTPGVLVGPNGLIAVTGAATLPVGGAVLALSALPRFAAARAIPRLIALQAVVAGGIVGLSVLGILVPRLVPAVPAARSPEAMILLGFGLPAFGALAARAASTFLLTRRIADLAVVAGLVFLATSLGARVRALTVRLAAKDTSTEEHTRRVALLAVEIGERLGLSPARLRSLAIGGLLHDIGKLSVPNGILQKPGPLEEAEFAVIKLQPERGRELLTELGGFDDSVRRLVLDHHERLDGSGRARAAPSARPARITRTCGQLRG